MKLRVKVVLTVVGCLTLALSGCKDNVPVGNGADHKQKAELSSKSAQPISCDRTPYTLDDLDTAALNVIWQVLGRYGPDSTESIARIRARAASLKKWTASVEDERIRGAYEHWIAYFLGRCDDAENNLKDNKPAGQTPEDEEREEKQRRAAALAQCLPRPPRTGAINE